MSVDDRAVVLPAEFPVRIVDLADAYGAACDDRRFRVAISGHATLTVDDVRRFLDTAGPLGIGTWRPRYGGFVVSSLKEVTRG